MSAIHLVTGGAGFIGNNIVRTLLAQGQRVRVFDNFSTGHRGNLADILEDIELIEGDLRSIDACRRATRGVSYVLHNAALPSVPRSIEDPHTTHEVNATGTLHLLIAAREAGVGRFVYASSSSIYGTSTILPRVETARPNPISPYAVSKLSGEQYCTAFFHSYGLETVCLRYFNVFGPRQGWDSPYAAVLPLFIRALQNGKRPTIFGDGGQSRDFTYIDNVVEANISAAHAPAPAGKVYNVGIGEAISVKQILNLLCTVMETATEPVFEPPRPGDLWDSFADISLARTDLNYKATVSVEEGLRNTLDWANANGF